MNNVAVIGGGAAGMMAAIMAARNGAEVTVFEPNADLGKKLRITGKGRCNLTNNCLAEDVIKNTVSGGKFLYSALTALPPEKTMEFFAKLGVRLKTERGDRVFPVSDNAGDVVSALEREIKRLGIRVRHERVVSLVFSENPDNKREVTGIAATGGKVPVEAVVIATGGLSYPKTGSTGDGYNLARSAGHEIVDPVPSLVPLASPDKCCADMQGLTLKNTGMTVFNSAGKSVYKDFGEILFAHFGLTGPMALSASAHMRDFTSGGYEISLNLKPALDDSELDSRLVRDLKEHANRSFSNSLGDLLPRLMIPVIVRLSGIDPDKKSNSVSKKERAALHRLLRSFKIKITGTRPIEEAVITAGGVSTKELTPATMESKLVSGLYFAGEIINCDAYTGGFNLQIAWSTGCAAGTAAAAAIKHRGGSDAG